MTPDLPGCAIRGVNLTRVYRSGGSDLAVFSGLNFEVARGEKLAAFCLSPWLISEMRAGMLRLRMRSLRDLILRSG